MPPFIHHDNIHMVKLAYKVAIALFVISFYCLIRDLKRHTSISFRELVKIHTAPYGVFKNIIRSSRRIWFNLAVSFGLIFIVVVLLNLTVSYRNVYVFDPWKKMLERALPSYMMDACDEDLYSIECKKLIKRCYKIAALTYHVDKDLTPEEEEQSFLSVIAYEATMDQERNCAKMDDASLITHPCSFQWTSCPKSIPHFYPESCIVMRYTKLQRPKLSFHMLPERKVFLAFFLGFFVCFLFRNVDCVLNFMRCIPIQSWFNHWITYRAQKPKQSNETAKKEEEKATTPPKQETSTQQPSAKCVCLDTPALKDDTMPATWVLLDKENK